MTSADSNPPEQTPLLTSRGYRITVDGGRDSFYALEIGEPDSETAWIVSDTVRSLEEVR